MANNSTALRTRGFKSLDVNYDKAGENSMKEITGLHP